MTANVISIHQHSALEAALAYARIGWHVLPVFGVVDNPDGTRRCACGKTDCSSPGKHPHGLLARNGEHAATTNESTIRSWFERIPNLNIGIQLSSSGLAAIDVDPRNGGAFTLEAIEARHGKLKTETVQQTGGGGQHYVFSYSVNQQLPGTLGNGIDVKHNGFIVVEPSRHSSGVAYAWEEGGDPRDGVALSPLPDWLRDMAWSRTTPDAPQASSRYVTPEQIDELRSALTQIPADDYDLWVKVGLALKSIGGAGFELWDTWSQGSAKYQAHVMGPKWRSFKPGALNYESIFHWAQAAGWANPLATVARAVPIEAVVLAPPEDRSQPAPAGGRPLGILGVVHDWIEATSRKPQPVFATQAALAFGSIVLGRRYVSSANNWPSLYFLNIGKSASGKEHAKFALERLLTACDLQHLIGPSGYTSDSGVLSSLSDQPAHLAIIDEFGKVLEAASIRQGARAASAMRALMEVWGRCDGTMRPQGYSTFGLSDTDKGKLKKIIQRPALTLLAMTTPETLFESVGSAAARDGFLNRFLIVETDIGRQTGRDTDTGLPIPQAIVDWVAACRSGDLVQQHDDPSLLPEGNVIPLAAGATALFRAFDAWCIEQMDRHDIDGLAEMFGRTNEVAMRVALIVAVSCQSATIRSEHAEWSIDYVRTHALRTVARLKTSVADSEFEAIQNRVLDVIRKSGSKGLTAREIVHRCRHFRALDVRGRAGVLSALHDGGEIAMVKIDRGVVNARGPQREAWVAIFVDTVDNLETENVNG